MCVCSREVCVKYSRHTQEAYSCTHVEVTFHKPLPTKEQMDQQITYN